MKRMVVDMTNEADTLKLEETLSKSLIEVRIVMKESLPNGTTCILPALHKKQLIMITRRNHSREGIKDGVAMVTHDNIILVTSDLEDEAGVGLEAGK